MLTSATWGSPDPTPAADSPVAGIAATPSDAWFDATDYAGAVAPGGDNWMAGWTSFQ